jgi:hypothetical protein
MRGLAGGILVVLALAVGGSPAMAADPLPAAPIFPADGATIAPPAVGQHLTVNFGCPPFFTPIGGTTPIGWKEYRVEFSMRPDLGPDGTLATAFSLWTSTAFPTNAAETECSGQLHSYYVKPGTYYWQVQRAYGVLEAGPVWSFTIANPAPPPPPPTQPTSPKAPSLSMTHGQAVSYALKMIGRNTNGGVVGLRRTCSRSSYRAFRCRLKWRIGRSKYSGTAKVFHWTDGNSRWWDYEFKGQRRRLGCSSRCVRRLSW